MGRGGTIYLYDPVNTLYDFLGKFDKFWSQNNSKMEISEDDLVY